MKTDFINLQLKFMQFCENNGIDQKKYYLHYGNAGKKEFATILKRGEDETFSGVNIYSFDALKSWMDGYTAAKNSNLFP